MKFIHSPQYPTLKTVESIHLTICLLPEQKYQRIINNMNQREYSIWMYIDVKKIFQISKKSSYSSLIITHVLVQKYKYHYTNPRTFSSLFQAYWFGRLYRRLPKLYVDRLLYFRLKQKQQNRKRLVYEEN